MKDNIKGNLLCFLLGILITFSIGAYANTLFGGNIVSYDNNKSGLSSTDMQNAIDELYDMATFGDAGSVNILEGKTALVNGNKVTGTLGTQTKSATPSISSQTITPDSGNLLSSVIVNAVDATKTLEATNGTKVDMGGAYRYVNTNAVYDAGKSAITGGTQTKLSQGSWSSNKMTVTASAGYNASELTTTIDASSLIASAGIKTKTGTVTVTGTRSSAYTFVDCGFTPKMILGIASNNVAIDTSGTRYWFWFAYDGIRGRAPYGYVNNKSGTVSSGTYVVADPTGNYTPVQVTNNGFNIKNYANNTSTSVSVTYEYTVFG